MKKTEDRRVLRTRNILMDTLLDLMIEKGYEAITVQDIVDRANVGRSTFYLHFTDKEQLLLGAIHQLHEFINEQKSNHVVSETPNENPFGFSLAMLQHAQSHRRLYKAIVGKKGGNTVMYHMQHMFADLVNEEITVFFPSLSLPVPRETVIDFIVNTFMTLLTWWMEQDMPCSAMNLNEIFHKLTLSGLKAFQ